jgi:hypothetical protein
MYTSSARLSVRMAGNYPITILTVTLGTCCTHSDYSLPYSFFGSSHHSLPPSLLYYLFLIDVSLLLCFCLHKTISLPNRQLLEWLAEF